MAAAPVNTPSSPIHGVPITCPNCGTYLFTSGPLRLEGEANAAAHTPQVANNTTPRNPTNASQRGGSTSTHYQRPQPSSPHGSSSHAVSGSRATCPHCSRVIRCQLQLLSFDRAISISGNQQSPQNSVDLPALGISAEVLSALEDTPNYTIERFLDESQENNSLVRVESRNPI